MKQMAIIKNVVFGLSLDCNPVGLSFNTYISEAVASSHFIPETEAISLIKSYGIDNVLKLEGKPCWVEVDDRRIKFIGSCKI